MRTEENWRKILKMKVQQMLPLPMIQRQSKCDAKWTKQVADGQRSTNIYLPLISQKKPVEMRKPNSSRTRERTRLPALGLASDSFTVKTEGGMDSLTLPKMFPDVSASHGIQDGSTEDDVKKQHQVFSAYMYNYMGNGRLGFTKPQSSPVISRQKKRPTLSEMAAPVQKKPDSSLDLVIKGMASAKRNGPTGDSSQITARVAQPRPPVKRPIKATSESGSLMGSAPQAAPPVGPKPEKHRFRSMRAAVQCVLGKDQVHSATNEFDVENCGRSQKKYEVEANDVKQDFHSQDSDSSDSDGGCSPVFFPPLDNENPYVHLDLKKTSISPCLSVVEELDEEDEDF